MNAVPRTIEEFCDWCIQWTRDGTGDPQNRSKKSWIVAGPTGVVYGRLPDGSNEELLHLGALRLTEAVEEHRPEFFAIVLALEIGPGSEEARYPPGDGVTIVAYSRGEERNVIARDGKIWELATTPGGAFVEIGRRVAAEWRRGSRYDERQEMISQFENPLLDRLANESLKALIVPGERVAKPTRLVELATELAAAVPKAKQKKLIRLASDYLEAWLPGSTASGAISCTSLIALLISQVASMRLEAAGLRSVVINTKRYGQIAVIHRATTDLNSITQSEFEQLAA